MHGKIENIKIEILKMVESSGNEQIFLRARRTDVENNGLSNGVLEYMCFQTKDGKSLKKCIDNALFGAGIMMVFFGFTVDDISFVGLSDGEIDYAKNSRYWKRLLRKPL